MQAAAPAPEVASPSPASTANPSPLPTLAPVRLPSIVGAVRPVSGGLLRGFSALPVLWPSLDCWQAHPAVDLGAASGETAVCMRDGVVLSCVRDDLWGWHVAVRQTDGAVCTYSGLSCALVPVSYTHLDVYKRQVGSNLLVYILAYIRFRVNARNLLFLPPPAAARG